VVDALPEGGFALLENVRFHAGEEENEAGFAARLAELGDIFVNDAFSAAHRAHASTAAIAHLLPAFAGKLMQAELEALAAALETPRRPLIALVGGAKVSTKLALLKFLLEKADILVIGGAMANTLLAAQGKPVGKSLCEHNLADTAREILAQAERTGRQLILPVDAVVAREFKAHAEHEVLPVDRIPEDGMMLDIGPETVAAIGARLEASGTVVWNGPLGAFETPPFDAGTIAVARRVADLTKAGKLLSVAGGGDTVAALAAAGVVDDLTYVSTAGGAFLEWLEGRELPAVAALRG
jgi:phosphoglycerate kinase